MKISALTTVVCLTTLALGAMAGSDQVHVATAQQQTASTPAPTTAATTTTTTTAPVKTVGAPAPAPAPASTIKSVEAPAPATKTGTTPAPTTVKAAATPAPTTSKPISVTEPSKSHCWYVSVEGDATYCIPGPICSGNGKTPAGVNCPLKGDVAVESCLKTLRSYVDATKCVAPVDAECKLIKTGAWGCVWKGVESVGSSPGKSSATPAPTTSKGPHTQVTPAPTTSKGPHTQGKAGGNETQRAGHSERRSKHEKSTHCV